ncbi:MAG: thioredoxin [Bacteroidota bacterium]
MQHSGKIFILLVNQKFLNHFNREIMAFVFTDDNFQAEAIDKGKVAVVDFWAEWCGPCKLIGPIIDELSDELDTEKITVGKVDVDSNPNLSYQYKVRSIPTILILIDGKEVDRQVGVTTKQKLLDKINMHMS